MEIKHTVTPEDLAELQNRLIEIYQRKDPPKSDEFIETIKHVNQILDDEDESYRPADSSNLPGGIILLQKNIPSIIVPDLHARIDFIFNLMFHQLEGEETILEKLAKRELQIVCVGDGLHSEIAGLKRWMAAFEEYKTKFKKHKHMDQEMRDGFGLVEMVQTIKSYFPAHFHFLKGNHENIANERGEGNYPFRKYVFEGNMVFDYVKMFYSDEFLDTYYAFEKKLPLFVIGRNFLISHAEPVTFFNTEEIIEYRKNPDVIEGLTWTDNNAAEEGSVAQMMEFYLEGEEQEHSYYFGGHRIISEIYKTRANGKYIQIHNPQKFVIAYIKPQGDIDLDRDIFEIENQSKYIIDQYK
jgi:hypothetical protein